MGVIECFVFYAMITVIFMQSLFVNCCKKKRTKTTAVNQANNINNSNVTSLQRPFKFEPSSTTDSTKDHVARPSQMTQLIKKTNSHSSKPKPLLKVDATQHSECPPTSELSRYNSDHTKQCTDQACIKQQHKKVGTGKTAEKAAKSPIQEDSFAQHRPKVAVAKRTPVIIERRAVSRERDDYKTFRSGLPSSDFEDSV
ncbi:unnamed protein product [Bursaphelenchus okinawaensis]|uniref:Uncharacterized protein n=1 Tax=Bursaphelenchus okinawaensis TaxID=465554 RepID=A0A811JQ73_9BILA|nr:unnamed protein product [Bursaphelenchus okinawaensis]CAG9077784.1 unnamed protein product [Bursaphelenchus okinawaensis]